MSEILDEEPSPAGPIAAPTSGSRVSPLRVLLVEASASDAAAVIHELEGAGHELEPERVETLAALGAALRSTVWDLILCEWSMPELSGRAALALLHERAIDVPFIVVSRAVGEENAVDAIRAGAHDYVLKNNLGRLPAAVLRELAEHQIRRTRKKEELARTLSQRRMQRMIECARVGVWYVAVDGNGDFMNERMAQILGLDPEDGAHATVADFVHEADRPGFAEGLASCKDGVPASYEQRYQRKDGSVGWGMFESSPLYDEGGAFEGVLTMMTDTSARRVALEAQQEAELRFRRAFDSRITGVTIVDERTGVIGEANDTFLELVGYSRDDLGAGALDWIAMTPVEWRARSAEATAELHTRGSTRPFEKEYLRKDGSRVSVLVGVALLGERRVLTLVTDLTDLKRVETALVQRVRVADLSAEVGRALTGGETLRRILQGCCDAVVLHLGAALTRVWTLNSATNMLELQGSAGMYTDIDGLHAKVPVGKLKIGTIAQERRPQHSNDVEVDLTADESDWARREGMRAFAGQPLLVGGQLLGVISTFSREPFTELVLETLISIADAMALRVRDKLTEDANLSLELQLRQSQKMDAVGRLAGGVAHDFNNLLSVVLSYSEMLIDDLHAGDPIRADVEEIRRAGVRAAELTRQLLMFSRQQVVEPRVLDLNELLSGMNKMLQRVVGEDVELTAVLGASLSRIRADPGSIEQVIMNLAINARDAMPTGGKLTMETSEVVLDEEYVRRHLHAQAGPHVMLCVTDTGVGMTPQTVTRIFEPFFTTKPLGKGTGLGLSMVFGIVRQSGGNVWVYSEPGVGTTFKIYLPRVDAIADEVRPDAAPVVLRGSETILLVEDEDQVRHVAHGILKRHGYTVIEARNPGEALLLSEAHLGTIHLLLTDVVMPQMGGPALARRLAPARPEMKVLCMSGYTDDAAVRHGIVDAAFAYLQKPITVQTLTRRVRELLGAPLPAS